MKRFVRDGTFVYLIALAAFWALLHFAGDRWWIATTLMFAPRWVVAIPLLLMLPLTIIHRPLLAPTYLIHAGMIVLPIMGFQVPVSTEGKPQVESLSVLTYNVGGGEIYPEAIVEMVERTGVDLVLLQECEPAFADEVFRPLGWNCRREELLAIGSKHPLGEAEVLARHEPQGRLAAAISCPVKVQNGTEFIVVNVHLPTPRPGLAAVWEGGIDGSYELRDVLKYREEMSRRVADQLEQQETHLIIAGDFNMPVDSCVYRNDWHQYQNAFSKAGFGWGYTKRTRWHGIRIDHVLADDSWKVDAALVEEDLGGDHLPLVAKLRCVP